MNTNSKPILTVILAIVVSFGVVFLPTVGFTQTQLPAVCGFTGTGSTTLSQSGGQWMKARDTVHVLIVFVQFPDDNYDPQYPLWPIGQPPTFMSTYIDSLSSQMSSNGNLTHYFREMSLGIFTLTGKTRVIVTPRTNQWYISNNWNRWMINKEVLETLDASMDFAEFDRWKRYTEYDIRREPDGKVDMIFMIYRHVDNMSALGFYGGEASLGYARYYPPYYEPTEFFVDSSQRSIGHGHPVFGYPGSGTTSVIAGTGDGWYGLAPYRVQIHEFAHHWMTNGSDYGHNGGGFWAMLNDFAPRSSPQSISCPNSFERERVGWIAPDSIFQTTYNLTLTDYITTGQAIKIKVSGGNPDEFFRIEYHLKTSQFDTPEMWDLNAKGLYILHQFGTSDPKNQLRLLPADGRWNWASDEVAYPSYYPQGLPVYKKTGIDRVNGQDDSRLVQFTWAGPLPQPTLPNPGFIHFYRDRRTNQLVEQTVFRGDGNDAFTYANNNIFSSWSNPNSYNDAKVSTGIAVEILSESNGVVVFNLHMNDVSAQTAPPSKPQNLLTNSVISGSTSLIWSANQEPDMVGYNIYRGLYYAGSPEPTYTKINSSVITGTTYTDNNYESITGLPQNIDLYHRYRITAVDNQGKESVKSEYIDSYFTYIVTLSLSTYDGWNMVSIPDVVVNFQTTAVYPSANSAAFSYSIAAGYTAQSMLTIGTGYWIKYNSVITNQYVGSRFNSVTIPVKAGWNLIGSISSPILISTVYSNDNPPVAVTSKYWYLINGSTYTAATSIEPGKAYWVRADRDGSLILSTSSTANTPPSTSPDLPPAPPSAPSAPANVTPTEMATGVSLPVQFSWEGFVQGGTYRLQVDDQITFSTPLVADVDSIANTSYTMSGLSPSTQYWWRVLQRNAVGESEWSETWSFTTSSGIQLSWTVYNTHPKLTWTAPSGITSPYKVYRYDCVCGEGDCGGTGSLKYSGSSLTYTDNGVIVQGKFDDCASTSYYYVKGTISGTSTLSGASNKVAVNNSNVYWRQGKPDIQAELPRETKLKNNYPNPFNPVTVINYSLAEDLYVVLKVYDVLGREVATLVDGFETAGYKSAQFDASALPSGVYIYKFTAGTVTDVKKMLLMK